MLKARGRDFKIVQKEIPWLLVMGLLMALSSLALFESYNFMDVGVASTLLFVYPIMVALIMCLVFKEKFSMRILLCIILALGGIGLLYKTGSGATLSLTGSAWVFVSALSYAIFLVGINQSRLKDMPTLKMTFYVLLFGFTLFLFRLDFGRSLAYPHEWYLWANLLALAVFPTVISFLCTTSAVHYVGSTPTAILGALEPVTAVFIGVAMFGEDLTFRESIGLVLIILAVTLVIAGGSITAHLIRFRKLFPRLPFKGWRRG